MYNLRNLSDSGLHLPLSCAYPLLCCSKHCNEYSKWKYFSTILTLAGLAATFATHNQFSVLSFIYYAL